MYVAYSEDKKRHLKDQAKHSSLRNNIFALTTVCESWYPLKFKILARSLVPRPSSPTF